MESKSQFEDILFNKLQPLEQKSSPSQQSPHSRPVDSSLVPQPPTFAPLFEQQQQDLFTLPSELQGGIGTISSRRPSYAAESFTRSADQLDPSMQYLGQGINNSNFQGHNNGSNNQSKNLAAFAAINNYKFNLDSFNDSFANFNLNANFNDFQARRPSQLVDFQSTPPPQNQFVPNYLNLPPQQQGQGHPQSLHHLHPHHQQHIHQQPQTSAAPPAQSLLPSLQESSTTHTQKQSESNRSQKIQHQQNPNSSSSQYHLEDQNQNQNHNQSQQSQFVKLENGLILHDQVILASSDLKLFYLKATKYFQNVNQTEKIINNLNNLVKNPTIIKLITFIKNLNNLTFNHKRLCLVINKNGKFDLLSCPNNSNLFLQDGDLVIVDGDRGKDLVMIIHPLVDLNFAILFNFLKKLEHLKSLTIFDSKIKKVAGGTHSTLLNASQIINSHSNEDNEFIITLPTKQVLRFATPKEVHKLSGKFLEEKKAFVTCLNKIRELNLKNDLELINVEYQSDFKKLIFYYFAGFKRIDFRSLIKELFKIYKTRIWLCAVLPFDKPELYITSAEGEERGKKDEDKPLITERNPKEYDLSNDQILKFSINEFQNLSEPNYFHSANLDNLIKHLSNEIQGKFYGFNNNNPAPTIAPTFPNKQKQVMDPISSQEFIPQRQQLNEHQMKSELHNPHTSKILPNFNPFGDPSS